MKYITILSFLLLLSPTFSVAQEKRISLGLVGSVGGNNYYFEETSFNHKYTSNTNYSFGFGFQYFFPKRVFVNSGMVFTIQGYQIEYNFVFMDPGDPAIPRISELKVYSIQIPIMAGFQLMETKKLRFGPSCGINLGFKVNQNESTIFEDDSERESGFLIEDLNKTLIVLSIRFGLEYHLSENFKIGIDPYICKSINKLDDQSMKSGQFSYGCILGFYLKL